MAELVRTPEPAESEWIGCRRASSSELPFVRRLHVYLQPTSRGAQSLAVAEENQGYEIELPRTKAMAADS